MKNHIINITLIILIVIVLSALGLMMTHNPVFAKAGVLLLFIMAVISIALSIFHIFKDLKK